MQHDHAAPAAEPCFAPQCLVESIGGRVLENAGDRARSTSDPISFHDFALPHAGAMTSIAFLSHAIDTSGHPGPVPRSNSGRGRRLTPLHGVARSRITR
jgi:hypothetical protein